MTGKAKMGRFFLLVSLTLLVALTSACSRGSEGEGAATTTAPAAAPAEAPAAEPAAPAAAPPASAGTPVAADFSPNPWTMAGRAGGPRDASTLSGVAPHMGCAGFIPEQPQHTLDLAAFDSLTLLAEGSVDLTMVVEGPNGRWCNDDFRGLNPGFTSAFPAGTYRIFVGTYAADVEAPYTLSLQRHEAVATTTQSLAPGFLPDPYTASSQAGGPRMGSAWTGTPPHSGCVGYYPAEPQHVLNLEAFENLKIVARPTTGGDLTMVIEGPAGTWCNDDFEGLNPGFDAAFPAGTYRVFVGTYGGGEMTPYSLVVTELTL